MKRSLSLLLLLVVLVPSVVLGQSTANQTINTMPSSNTTFLTDLQTFLRSEDANRFAQMFQGFAVSGGTHSTGAGLTWTPATLTAYPNGQYTTESGSITYADASTTYVIADQNISGNSGSFTRVAGTHYLTATGAKPSLPTGAIWLMQVTTSGGAVTAVTDLRTRAPFGIALNLSELPAAGTRGRFAFVLDDNGGTYYWDNGASWVSAATSGKVVVNWLVGPDFKNWPQASLPVGWSKDANSTIALTTTSKLGGVAVQITPGVSAGQLFQDVDLASYNGGPVARWQSKQVTLGVWVRATAANAARIGVDDGVTTTYSNYHVGNSTYAFLSVSKTLSASATRVRAILEVAVGGAASQFDGATFGEGSVITEYIPPIVPTVATLPARTYATNGSMESFGGTLPVSWTLNGAGASTAQNTTAGQFKEGASSVSLTRAGTDAYLSQDVSALTGQGPIGYWQNRLVTMSSWVRAIVASRARICLNDGVDTTCSPYQTGGSSFEFLTVTKLLGAAATKVELRLQVDTGNTTAQFDSVNLFSGPQAVDNIPIIAATVPAPMAGQLQYVSGTSIKFCPYNGGRIRVAAVDYDIPTACVVSGDPTAAVNFVNGTGSTALSASTTYLVTVFVNSGTLTLDFLSTLTHTQDTAAGNVGVEIKSGDNTRTVVGMIRTNATPNFVDSDAQRFTISWFNRRPLALVNGFAADRTTTSTSYVELSSSERIEFLVWTGQAVFLAVAGAVDNSGAGGANRSSLGIDGTTAENTFSESWSVGAGNKGPVVLSLAKSGLSEGYHYATILGKVSGGTGTWNGSATAGLRTTITGVIHE